MKSYWKVPEICSKNLENHNFRLPPAKRGLRGSSLGPLELWNFFKKLANKILVTSWKHRRPCRFFHEKIFQQGVFQQTPTRCYWPLRHVLFAILTRETATDDLLILKKRKNNNIGNTKMTYIQYQINIQIWYK